MYKNSEDKSLMSDIEVEKVTKLDANQELNYVGLEESEIEKIKQAYNDAVGNEQFISHMFKFWRIWNSFFSIIAGLGILYIVYVVFLKAIVNQNWMSDYFMLLILMSLFIKLRINHSNWLNKDADINHENVELLVDPKTLIYRVLQVVKTKEYTIFVSIDKVGLLRRRKKTYFVYRRLDNIKAVDAKSQRFNDKIQTKLKTRFYKHFHYIDVDKM